MRKEIRKVIYISLFINIILTMIKLLGGYFYKSQSLIGDGFNSLADIFISLLLIATYHITSKGPDKNHPYGHEKFEGVLYLFLGLIIAVTSLYIIYSAIVDLIIYFETKAYLIPSKYALIVAGVALFFKIFLFYINRKASQKYDSPTLKADSINHFFDIFATLLSFIGILLAQLNLIFIEYGVTVVIGIIIFKTGAQMLIEAVSYLVDQSPGETIVKAIKVAAKEVDGVIRVDEIKARKHMSKIYVDMEIAVDETLSLKDAHLIAENVHDKIENDFDVIHCMVHVNPKKNN